MDRRARITLPDVLFGLFTFALLAALWPVVSDALGSHAGELSQGELLLYQAVLPLVLLVFLTGLYRKAAGGGA